MALWAIVPVKPLRRGKSRLAPVLSEDDRAELNQRLLLHTVDLLKGLPEIVDVLVVSRDSARQHRFVVAGEQYLAASVRSYGTIEGKPLPDMLRFLGCVERIILYDQEKILERNNHVKRGDLFRTEKEQRIRRELFEILQALAGRNSNVLELPVVAQGRRPPR